MARSTQQVVVNVETRAAFGKNACRRLRAQGRVPGNVYGLSMKSFPVAVDPYRVEEVLHMASGRNTIFTLSLGDGDSSRAVMLRELQRDPVTGRLVHVDFVRVDPHKRIHVKVPVRLVGTPVGVKNEGGLLDFVHREVEVSCMPAEIPEHLDVDVSELHNNQHVAVKDLTLGKNVELLEDEETILAVVAAPRVEVVEAAEEVEAEEAEAAEEGEPKPSEEGTEEQSENK